MRIHLHLILLYYRNFCVEGGNLREWSKFSNNCIFHGKHTTDLLGQSHFMSHHELCWGGRNCSVGEGPEIEMTLEVKRNHLKLVRFPHTLLCRQSTNLGVYIVPIFYTRRGLRPFLHAPGCRNNPWYGSKVHAPWRI